jgi:hypothetical protein
VPESIPFTTTTEWWAAGAAAVLVVALGALHLVRLGPGRGTSDRVARLAGWLLACVAATFVLVVATLVGASVRASMVSQADIESGTDLPAGPFVRHLFDPDLATTERVGPYSAAFLLPLAVAFAALALAVTDRVRSAGLRLAALTSSLVVGLGALYLALGTSSRFHTDPGPLAGRVAAGVVVLAVAVSLLLAADLRRGGWSSPGPIPVVVPSAAPDPSSVAWPPAPQPAPQPVPPPPTPDGLPGLPSR